MGFNSVIFFRKIPNSVKSRFFFWVFLLKFWPFRMVRTRYILLKTNPTRLKTSLTSIQGVRSSVCQRPDRSGDFLGPKKVRAIFCRHITNYISKRVQVIFILKVFWTTLFRNRGSIFIIFRFLSKIGHKWKNHKN